VVINEVFLNGSIKPFHVGIHFGRSAIPMPMVFVEPSNFLIEVLHAFRAIVGKHGLKRIEKDLGNDPEEFAGQPMNRGSEWPRQRQIRSSDR